MFKVSYTTDLILWLGCAPPVESSIIILSKSATAELALPPLLTTNPAYQVLLLLDTVLVLVVIVLSCGNVISLDIEYENLLPFFTIFIYWFFELDVSPCIDVAPDLPA